jgi:hypothetical protein
VRNLKSLVNCVVIILSLGVFGSFGTIKPSIISNYHLKDGRLSVMKNYECWNSE